MIAPYPLDRYRSFDEAVAAIAHRNLDVEIARDSFTRILGRSEKEAKKFFFKFYSWTFASFPERANTYWPTPEG
jgi:hypothetical protein